MAGLSHAARNAAVTPGRFVRMLETVCLVVSLCSYYNGVGSWWHREAIRWYYSPVHSFSYYGETIVIVVERGVMFENIHKRALRAYHHDGFGSPLWKGPCSVKKCR